ncbi:MAG: ATP synthase subunit C [Firmicutes bacterium]|nr:ATP synthase subunit C [Bacillota bacterium]
MTALLLIIIPIASIIVSMIYGKKTLNKTGNAAKSVKSQIVSAFALSAFCMIFTCVGASAEGSETVGEAASNAAAVAGSLGSATGLGFIAAALSIGLSAIGAGIALAAGAPAAIGAVSENPQSFGKAMIFVVLGEAVALYGFVIAFMIIAKLPSFAEVLSSLI